MTAQWSDVNYFTLIVPVNWRGLEIGLWGRVWLLLSGAFRVDIELRGDVLEARKSHALALLSPDQVMLLGGGGSPWGTFRKLCPLPPPPPHCRLQLSGQLGAEASQPLLLGPTHGT